MNISRAIEQIKNRQVLSPIIENKENQWSNSNRYNSTHSGFRHYSSMYNNSLNPHSQNAKNDKFVRNLTQRQQSFQAYLQQQFSKINSELIGGKKKVNDTMQENSIKIQQFLLQLQDFYNCTLNKYGEGQQLLVNEQSKNLIQQRFKPFFFKLRKQQTSTQNQKVKCSIISTEQKVDQIVQVKVDEERDCHQELLKLLNKSSFHTEQLDKQIRRMDEEMNESLIELQDNLEKIDFELELSIKRSIEERKRQDKYLQQLIEKMIYKMIFL